MRVQAGGACVPFGVVLVCASRLPPKAMRAGAITVPSTTPSDCDRRLPPVLTV